MSLSSCGGVGFGLRDSRRFVGSAVAEHGVDDVEASADEADQRSVVSFLLGVFSVAVGPLGGVAEAGERGEEQRGLEGVVAALGASLALDRGPGSAGHGGQAGIGGEVTSGGERRAVADDGEDFDGGPDPEAGDRDLRSS
jgi:hypothetical protein